MSSERRKRRNGAKPTLNMLLAFEATARHMSLKVAASELCLTPSAVSHRLRVLEDTLGQELFRRSGRRVELTEAGSDLGRELTLAFGRIFKAVEAARR